MNICVAGNVAVIKFNVGLETIRRFKMKNPDVLKLHHPEDKRVIFSFDVASTGFGDVGSSVVYMDATSPNPEIRSVLTLPIPEGANAADFVAEVFAGKKGMIEDLEAQIVAAEADRAKDIADIQDCIEFME